MLRDGSTKIRRGFPLAMAPARMRTRPDPAARMFEPHPSRLRNSAEVSAPVPRSGLLRSRGPADPRRGSDYKGAPHGPPAWSARGRITAILLTEFMFQWNPAQREEGLEPTDTGPGDRGPSIDAAEAGTAIRTRENPAMAAHDFELKNVGTVASIIGIVVLVLGLVGVFFGN